MLKSYKVYGSLYFRGGFSRLLFSIGAFDGGFGFGLLGLLSAEDLFSFCHLELFLWSYKFLLLLWFGRRNHYHWHLQVRLFLWLHR